MRASELIIELHQIMDDTESDPEINEYWLRVLLDINIQKYIDIKTGKPTLKVVGENDVT